MLSYWFRLIFNFFYCYYFGAKLKIQEAVERWSIVLPDQIDMNFHMNNSHFYNSLELARVEFLVRTGLFTLLNKEGCTTMLAGQSLQFRRQLNLFQVFTTTCQVSYVDEKWVYIEQEMWSKGLFVARGISRIGIVDKKTQKLVNPQTLLKPLSTNESLFSKSNQKIETFISHDDHLKEK